MSLEVLGLVTLFIGLSLLGAPVFWIALFMALSTIFGATAAFGLPALGGASILVPNLFLVFFMARIYIATGEGPILDSVMPPKPGFWLLILTIFGVLSAYFLPRIFAGTTETLTIMRSLSGINLITQLPLKATTSNITQAVYAIGGLLCFVFAFAWGQKLGSPKQILTIFLVVGAVNVAFAFLDLVTHYTNTAYIMDLLKTANVRVLGGEKAGIKRISGTFPEASAFADYSLALFAFAASAWLDKVQNRAAGCIAFLLLLALVFSTSATALVGIVVVCFFLGVRTISSSMGLPEYSRPAFLAASSLAAILVLLAMPLLFPELASEVKDYLDEIVFNKLDSHSGRERSQWNAAAFQTFMDTSGFGAGIGSARASSLALVLLSNVGVVGAILFTIFAASILVAKTGWSTDASVDQLNRARVARALKAGFVSLLVTKMITQTVYDLGLFIYLLGGLCSAICHEGINQRLASKTQRTALIQNKKMISSVASRWSKSR